MHTGSWFKLQMMPTSQRDKLQLFTNRHTPHEIIFQKAQFHISTVINITTGLEVAICAQSPFLPLFPQNGDVVHTFLLEGFNSVVTRRVLRQDGGRGKIQFTYWLVPPPVTKD